MIEAKRVDDGLWEWANVDGNDECGFVHAEKVSRGVVHIQGDATVELHGSLFSDGPTDVIILLTPGSPMAAVGFLPWRIRPVVKEGQATIRLYIPRG